MADQDFNHTAEIIKAALPFVDSKIKGLAELFAKLLDLMGSFKSAESSGELSAVSYRDIKVDIEGLLKGIRPICNANEQEIVDRILNIFNMKRMFEMYNTMMSTMNAMQDSGLNFNTSGSGSDASNTSGNFPDFSSIFQSFNKNTSDNSKSTPDPDAFSANYNPFNTADPPEAEKDSASAPDKDTSTQSNNSSGPMNMNGKMFDMLKTMVPPEQMSTFENLSMLLNTMSYDNNNSNSKPDEKKE